MPPTDADQTAQALAEARARGEGPAIAEALVAHAERLTAEGRFVDAIAALDEAAVLHGDGELAATCTHWAATLARAAGDLAGADERARRARRLAAPGSDAALAAATELAEVELRRGHPSQAAEWLTTGIEETEGLAPGARGTLLRKRAAARAGFGRLAEAADDAAAAARLLDEAGAPLDALAAGLEEVSARWQANQRLHARTRLGELRSTAEQAGASGILADAAVLDAAMALDEGDPDRALDAARRARDLALDAVAPLTYLSAAVTISELADQRGDRVGAYRSLATAWATLGDLMGRDAAAQAVTPRLEALRDRWGPATFAEVKAEHDEQRRRERAAGAADR